MAESPVIRVRVSQDVHDALQNLASEENKSMTILVREILSKSVNLKEKSTVQKIGRPANPENPEKS